MYFRVHILFMYKNMHVYLLCYKGVRRRDLIMADLEKRFIVYVITPSGDDAFNDYQVIVDIA